MLLIKNEFAVEVVAGIVWQQERILVARRPEGKRFAGFWEFPGGKMEQGESREQALVRELQEELGIQVQAASYWKSHRYLYPQGPVLLHFFHVYSFFGQAKALEKQCLRWSYPQDALRLNFLPPDIPILQELAGRPEM